MNSPDKNLLSIYSGSINIDGIIELSDKDKGGHLDLPYNLTVDKRQNALTFTKHKKNVSMSRRKKK